MKVGNSGQTRAMKAIEQKTDFSALAEIQLWLFPLCTYFYVRHCAKSFTCIISCNPHDPIQWILSPFYRLLRVSNLLRSHS